MQSISRRDMLATAAAPVEIDPGGLREMHWHPAADEWQYCIEGRRRMGVFGASDFQVGVVGYVRFAMGHYIENTDTTPLRFLEMFKSSYDADFSLDTWLALTPPELLRAQLKLDRQVVDASRTNRTPVVPAPFETATGKPGSPYPRPPAE